jgi:hypothetical protein
MTLSAFNDRSRPPRENEVEKVLGDVFPLWRELESALATEFGPTSEEWGFSGASTGWGLRIRTPKRTIVYMTPREGHFLASFAIGEKAAAAARESGLAATVLAAMDSARRYAEGRAVRLEVRRPCDVAAVVALARVKMAN